MPGELQRFTLYLSHSGFRDSTAALDSYRYDIVSLHHLCCITSEHLLRSQLSRVNCWWPGLQSRTGKKQQRVIMFVRIEDFIWEFWCNPLNNEKINGLLSRLSNILHSFSTQLPTVGLPSRKLKREAFWRRRKTSREELRAEPGGGRTGVNRFLVLACQRERRQLKGLKTDTELDLFLPDK